MAINITSIEDALTDNGLKILVHGPAGSGKTVLCATTGMPTILLSAEAGLLSLKKYLKDNKAISKNIKIIKIESFADLEEVYDCILFANGKIPEDKILKLIPEARGKIFEMVENVWGILDN